MQFTLLLQNRILKRKRRIFIVLFYVTTPWFQHILESSLPDIVWVDFLNHFVKSERVDFLLGIVGEIPIFGPELQNTEHKTRRLHSWKISKIRELPGGCCGEYFKQVIFYGKWQHFHLHWNINVSLHSLSTDYKQSTEAINMKPTPGTAPGTQLSGEVSYFFARPSIGPPALTNQRVSSLVFKVSRIIE